MTSHHLTKTIAARLFPLCIAGMILFSGCGSNSDSAPTTSSTPTSDPSSTSTSSSTPTSTSEANSEDTTTQVAKQEPGDAATPTTEGQERKIFDDYVGGYEVENGIDNLVDADQSIHQDFFDSISTEGYDLVLAREDLQTVSDSNKPLLEEFIQWVENLHETCNFDRLVEQFITENPDVDLSQDPTQLYQYLNEQGMTVDYVLNTACDNEYAQGFIEYTNGVEYREGPILTLTDPDDVQFQHSTPEEMEESQRQFEEWLRQEQLEAEELERKAKEAGDFGGTGNM